MSELAMPCGTCGKDVRTPRQWLACREHFVADIKRLKMEVEGLERFRELRTRHGQELADRTTQLANAEAELRRYENTPPSGDFSIGSKYWPGISKLIEECGEVVQVGGKLLGSRGEVEHWDGSNLKDRLEDEIGDVLAACSFVVQKNGLNAQKISSRHHEKLKLFLSWQLEQATKPAASCRDCGHKKIGDAMVCEKCGAWPEGSARETS